LGEVLIKSQGVVLLFLFPTAVLAFRFVLVGSRSSRCRAVSRSCPSTGVVFSRGAPGISSRGGVSRGTPSVFSGGVDSSRGFLN
jgi:hypothetical protein